MKIVAVVVVLVAALLLWKRFVPTVESVKNSYIKQSPGASEIARVDCLVAATTIVLYDRDTDTVRIVQVNDLGITMNDVVAKLPRTPVNPPAKLVHTFQ